MKAWIPITALCALVGFVLFTAQPVQSNATVLPIVSSMAAVPGPLVGLNSCTVSVDSNPDGGTDLVQCSDSVGHAEIFCENRSTTSVFYGGATDDLDSVAPCISTDTANCQRDAFRFSVRKGILAADTASGTATLYCTEGR
jgi:hypothetical protein